MKLSSLSVVTTGCKDVLDYVTPLLRFWLRTPASRFEGRSGLLALTTAICLVQVFQEVQARFDALTDEEMLATCEQVSLDEVEVWQSTMR